MDRRTRKIVITLTSALALLIIAVTSYKVFWAVVQVFDDLLAKVGIDGTYEVAGFMLIIGGGLVFAISLINRKVNISDSIRKMLGLD